MIEGKENNNSTCGGNENDGVVGPSSPLPHPQPQPIISSEAHRDKACEKSDDDEEAVFSNGKQSVRVTRSDPLASSSGRSHSIRSGAGSRLSSQSHKLPSNHHSKERRARWIRDKMNNYYQQQLAQNNNSLEASASASPSSPGPHQYNIKPGGPGALYHHHYPPSTTNGSPMSMGQHHQFYNGQPRNRHPLSSTDSSGMNYLPSRKQHPTRANWLENSGGTNNTWMSESDSKSAKFHRPYSVREQRSWAQPSILSSPLQSVEEGAGSRERLRAGLSLPVPVENGRYLEFKEGNLHRYSGNYHQPSEGAVEVAGLGVGDDGLDVADHNNFHQGEEEEEAEEDDEDEEEDPEEGEDDPNKLRRSSTSTTSYHFTRQTRPPYPYCLKSRHHNNLSGGGGDSREREGGGGGLIGTSGLGLGTIRSRSQSPCSITSESAESQGEKALDPPRLSVPSEELSVGGHAAGALNGGNRGRKMSVLFSSYDAWNEDNIVHSFKEMTPAATSVFEAAWTGNLEVLEELFNEEDPDNEQTENLRKLREGQFRDSEGRTPLHLASACGHVPCVELLLSRGAEVNSLDGNEHGATPLACAASCGSDQVVTVLLSHGANVNSGYEQGKTALHWAVQAGSVDCARTLLEAGAKQNPPQVYSETPLHIASALGDPACLQLLLDHGADVNLCKGSNRSTALHLSAEEGSAACIRLLLKGGASHAAKDIRGHTALHVAATCDADSVVALLMAGADPNTVDANGRTPLHCAVSRGSRAAECVRLLVQSGADIDAQDNYGYTPLHLSAVNESSQCASILLHHGSDVTLKTNAGTNALSLLVRRIPDVMRYLVDRLDSAVTIHDHDPADPDCEIRLDFRGIVPNCEKRVTNGKLAGNGFVKGNNSGGIDAGGGGAGVPGGGDKRDYFHKPHKETEFLTCLVAAGNKKILAHPLSEAFLTLKWRRVRKFFWASLLFQIALVALFSIYVVEVYLIRCPYKRDHQHGPPAALPIVQENNLLWLPPVPPPEPPGLSNIGNQTPSSSEDASHNITRRSADPGFKWFGLTPTKRNKSKPYRVPEDSRSGIYPVLPPGTSISTPSPTMPSPTRRNRGRNDTPIMFFPNGTIAYQPPQSSAPIKDPPPEDHNDAREEADTDLRKVPINCRLTPSIQVIWILLVTFVSLLALKEIFQLLQSPLGYVVSVENWGQWLLIASVTMTAWSSPQYQLEYWQYPAAACGIFLAWGMMLLQVGRFPALGLYVQMLGKVAANFGLFILAYACLLIAFALAFCVLFPEHPPYSSVALSILKVFTMMVGEVDYEDLFYSDERTEDPILFPVTAHLLYGAFVIIVTIVLMNLLVGLAVHDIQGLQKGAKLNRLSRQTALISRLESFIFSKKLQTVLPKTLGSILQKSALLVPSSYNWSFYFRPNDPRDKRLPKDIKLASLRLAAARQSSGKSKSHHHHHHSHHYHNSGGLGGGAPGAAAELNAIGGNTPRPMSSVSQSRQRNQSSTLQHHPEVSIRRIEQRLDLLQNQLDHVLGNLNGRMAAVLDVLLEQKPDLQLMLQRQESEIDNDRTLMEDGVFLAKSCSVSPSPSGVSKKPSLSGAPSILKDVSCEKG